MHVYSLHSLQVVIPQGRDMWSWWREERLLGQELLPLHAAALAPLRMFVPSYPAYSRVPL